MCFLKHTYNEGPVCFLHVLVVEPPTPPFEVYGNISMDMEKVWNETTYIHCFSHWLEASSLLADWGCFSSWTNHV